MNHRTTATLVCLGVLFSQGLSGCGPKTEKKEDEIPECSFVFPQSRENIQDYVEYTGRTAAVESVDVKARVTGYLKEVLFTEGAEVRKGQKLFLIDPEPYIAQYEQAKAQVGLYDAQVKLTTATYNQANELAKKNPKTFSALQLRTYQAQMVEAKAGLDSAKANLKIYEINRNFTTVTSPIDGVVGRKNQTPGNVIVQDQTLLTTVVALDRMFVYFDMDAPTFGRFRQPAPGKTPPPSAPAPVTLELPGVPTAAEGDQPSQVPGTIDFFNNQFNPATDTILVRGVFPNPKKTNGGARLRPGMFVRLKVPVGHPYRALVVPDRAILSKMGKKYVYVVGEGNRVKEVPVVIGQVQEKGLRVIKGGQLTDKDRVIITRLLDIQPNQEIRPVPLPAPPGSGVRGQGSGVRDQGSGVKDQKAK